MSADLAFLDEIILGLDISDLEWLEIRIKRRKESMHPEKIVRKTIIRKLEMQRMKEIMIVLALLFLGGVAFAEEIEPGEDILTVNSDGEIISIFSIDAWLNDVEFKKPAVLVNGSYQIGGMKPAGS